MFNARKNMPSGFYFLQINKHDPETYLGASFDLGHKGIV